MFIKSVTFEEVNPIINPTPRNLPKLKDRFYFVVRAGVQAYTIEFTDPPDDKPGFVKITGAASQFKEMITSMEFEDDKEIGYKFSDFEDWLMKKSGYHNSHISETNNQYTFVAVCIEHLTNHCIRYFDVERASLLIPITVHKPTAEQVKYFNQERAEVEARIRDLKKRDKIHKTTVANDVVVSEFELLSTAEHVVMYGTMHFGKIKIGSNCIHVRLHQFLNGTVQFHAIDTTRHSMVWKMEDPLVYFDY
jgi:hypothetical protein